MLPAHLIAHVAAEQLLEDPAQRHVRAPDFRMAKIKAEHEQIGVLPPAGIPGRDFVGPVAVDHRRVGFLHKSAVDAGEQIMALPRKLRHGRAALRQTIVPGRVEPEAMVGARIKLRRHRQAMFMRTLQADHQKGAFRQFGPETMADIGLVAHPHSPVHANKSLIDSK